jgi:hypothetical protein
MSAPVVPAAPSPTPRTQPDSAHQVGVWSLLMLPCLLPAAIASALVSLSILGSQGLDGSEPMSVQGGAGWVALILGWAILMSPMVVGVILGAKARARGERLGTVGMIVDGVILAGYTLLLFGSTLT